MQFISNPLKGTGISSLNQSITGEICVEPAAARNRFSRCPAAHVTPLLDVPALAARLGVQSLHLKDERGRMGLGSFKALGATHAIAKLALKKTEKGSAGDYESTLTEYTFVCASAGNHGLSVAAGARLFGAAAVIYLSDTVGEEFALRLRNKGATVRRQGRNYEASMKAAVHASEMNGWYLLSDSSWPGYSQPAQDVMEGYLIMGAEVADQIGSPPTHIFLQAGVGGLAAACTAAARTSWGEQVMICVVEPEHAPALINSIVAGKPVTSDGPASNMGRLDCKEPSHIALNYLAMEADGFIAISDEEAVQTKALLAEHDIDTSPSGAAGLAGLHHVDGQAKTALGLDEHSRVLAYITEGDEDEQA